MFHFKKKDIEIFKRLDAVKSLVPKGTRLLDIGTDHAYLPIELVQDKVVVSAIASDVNEKPLSRAEYEISKKNLSNQIQTILSNGFENIPENTFDYAAICGMGGHLIAEIIQNGMEKAKNCHLILQPMSYPEALRKYLYDNGFEILNEVFAYENNKPYVIILSKFSDKKTEYSFSDLIFGKFRPDNNFYYLYEKKIQTKLQKRIIGILKHQIELLDTES